uniref:Uncharacterized protein n=1 Tax=Photinus pyralis TaxID=7054 RepID=A0A1Y1JYE9_PHOPY
MAPRHICIHSRHHRSRAQGCTFIIGNHLRRNQGAEAPTDRELRPVRPKPRESETRCKLTFMFLFGSVMIGESSKKRKATGPQLSGTPGEQRLRSPPPFIQSSLSNPPPGRKGGHKRQRSDVPWYRPSSHHHHHSEDPERGPRSVSPPRDGHPEFSQERYGGDSIKHSVSTLLTYEPSRSQFNPTHEPERPMPRRREEEGMPRERTPPRTSEQS